MAKTTKKKDGKKARVYPKSTSITIRGDTVDLLEELGKIVEAEVGIALSPPQVLELALKNEVARRKDS